MARSFWSKSIIDWELQRYEGPLRWFFYSSLNYRQKYLVSILTQLPKGSRVLELGCGTGRLFDALPNKHELHYTGIDISEDAIEVAKKKFSHLPDTHWLCRELCDIENYQADYIVSAGLLDWVSDQDIRKFLTRNQGTHHIHSFSGQKSFFRKKLHILFSGFIRRKNSINYQPRDFSESQILANLNQLQNLRFVYNSKLSFGAFVHNLPSFIESSFQHFLVQHYFARKAARTGLIEAVIKKRELALIQAEFSDLSNLHVLEIGSGTGHYTKWLLKKNPKSLVCIDNSVDTRAHVPSENYSFYLRSLEGFTSERKFDVVLALGVLEFAGNTNFFFEKLLATTAVGSRIVLLVPAPNRPAFLLYSIFHFLRGIHPKAISAASLTKTLAHPTQKYTVLKKDGGFLNNLFIIIRDA